MQLPQRVWWLWWRMEPSAGLAETLRSQARRSCTTWPHACPLWTLATNWKCTPTQICWCDCDLAPLQMLCLQWGHRWEAPCSHTLYGWTCRA